MHHVELGPASQFNGAVDYGYRTHRCFGGELICVNTLQIPFSVQLKVVQLDVTTAAVELNVLCRVQPACDVDEAHLCIEWKVRQVHFTRRAEFKARQPKNFAVCVDLDTEFVVGQRQISTLVNPMQIGTRVINIIHRYVDCYRLMLLFATHTRKEMHFQVGPMRVDWHATLLLYEPYANESSQICPFLAVRPQFESVHHQNRRLSSDSYSHESVIFFVFLGLIFFKLRRVCVF